MGSVQAQAQENMHLTSDVTDNSPSTTDSLSIDSSEFTEEELQQVRALVPQINIMDSGLVVRYASEAQSGLSDVSDRVLKQVKSKVSTSVGDDFESLQKTLSQINVDNPALQSSFGFTARKAIRELIINYHDIDKSIDKIVERLKEHQLIIMQDEDILNEQKRVNARYLKILSLYILAGELRVQEIEKKTLPPLEAASSRSAENAERYRKALDALDFFKKKLFDLRTARQIATQNDAQIRLLLMNDHAILSRINSLLTSTIPLWKNQIALTLGLSDAHDAMEYASKVTETATGALQDNTKRIRALSKKVAWESKRKGIDVAELKRSNADLQDAIAQGLMIQRTGHQLRLDAEKSLKVIEDGLADKLKKTGGA